MTNYSGAIASGNGLIGASFREMPEDSRDLVLHLADRLSAIGLGGFMEIARPGQSVLEVQPSQGRIGSIVIGGLNPIAIVEEQGQRVVSRPGRPAGIQPALSLPGVASSDRALPVRGDSSA